MGLAMREGVRLAVAELNSMGGLLGRPIELVERNDRANPEVGRQIALALTVQEQVTATIGIVNTGVGLASIDIYQKARTPLMVAVSTGPELTRRYAPPASDENYIFRVSPTLEMEAQVLADELARRNQRHVAILADTTAYGEAGKQALEKWFAINNIRITGIGRFDVGATDMRQMLRRLRTGQPQALVVWGIGPELAQIAKDRQAIGWPVALCGGWTFSMSNFIDAAGAAGEGALMTQSFIQEGGLSHRNAFLLAYAQQTQQARMASPMSAAQGYDGMYLLASGIRQAAKADGAAIKNALENLKTPMTGVVTSYAKPFDRVHHDAVGADILMVGVVAQGRVTYAYPQDAHRGLLAQHKVPSRQSLLARGF